jgi:hypothetical protein
VATIRVWIRGSLLYTQHLDVFHGHYKESTIPQDPQDLHKCHFRTIDSLQWVYSFAYSRVLVTILEDKIIALWILHLKQTSISIYDTCMHGAPLRMQVSRKLALLYLSPFSLLPNFPPRWQPSSMKLHPLTAKYLFSSPFRNILCGLF